MNTRGIVLMVILFILIIVGMFTFSYMKKSEIDTSIQPPVVVEDKVLPYADIVRIDATHYFIDGEHTFVGELNMPTPCDLLEGEAVVMESDPEQIRLDFMVINTSANCAQVITSQRFKVSATASEEASISATFMGREVELNLIPAPAGETPEEFEVFIKG